MAPRLYPNPFSDAITLETTTPLSDVRIHDAAGKIVYQVDRVKHRQSIDLSHLPAGMYVVRYTSGGEAATRKIVKR